MMMKRRCYALKTIEIKYVCDIKEKLQFEI